MSNLLQQEAAPSGGRFTNTGRGHTFQAIDIGHPKYIALIEPNTAFWSLVKRENLGDVIAKKDSSRLLDSYAKKSGQLEQEMNTLRFGLKPSAVYFNPTERCNLNCSYCYIPEKMRGNGLHMPTPQLLDALRRLKEYFNSSLPNGTIPQLVFHGAEPLLNREAVFAGIETFKNDFRFGIQTNATSLDGSAIEFLASRNVSIGISLDATTPAVSDLTRKDWNGRGIYPKVLDAMERLRGYPAWSVICTITNQNLNELTKMVDLLHRHEVPTCLMNIVRCTLEPSRKEKPNEKRAADAFIAALDRTYELYRESGRKLVVGNFANILLAILAPTARRLMCDISPCGGGRCFFSVTPNGDLFPCSEFIGLESFKGGNLFEPSGIEHAIASEQFHKVSKRMVEGVEHCKTCSIRHFCGSPCPAEAHEMNGGMDRQGAFCEFYEEQMRYAFRLIADKKESAFLWDNWDKEMERTFDIATSSP